MGNIGDRIRAVRKERRLSQEKFSEKLEVSRGAVGNWERGEGIKRENLVRISKVFGVSLEWLAGDENTRADDFKSAENKSLTEGEPIDHVLADVASDMAYDFQREHGGTTEDFIYLSKMFYRQLLRKKLDGSLGSNNDH